MYLDSSTTIIMEVYADCGCRTNVVVFVDRYCCAILFVDCVFWAVDLLCYCKCCILYIDYIYNSMPVYIPLIPQYLIFLDEEKKNQSSTSWLEHLMLIMQSKESIT